jgi:hypothetical protein
MSGIFDARKSVALCATWMSGRPNHRNFSNIDITAARSNRKSLRFAPLPVTKQAGIEMKGSSPRQASTDLVHRSDRRHRGHRDNR